MAEHSTKPGRPRSPRADEAILAAARELMAEGGLGNLTVEGTALRAGVAKTTVYRRYPSKLDLAVAAIAALVADAPAADSIEDATTAGLTLFEQSMGSSGSQASYLAVAAAAAQDPTVHERFAETVLDPVQRNLAVTLQEAIERGEASRHTDLDFVYDVLIGTLMHRLVIRKKPMDAGFATRFTELVRFVYNNSR